MKPPVMEIGAETKITLQDGTEVKAIVREAIEEQDAWIVKYILPEWGGYKTQWHRYRKGVDWSGIDKMKGMPVEYMSKKLSDFNWDVYGVDKLTEREIAESFITRFDDFRRQGRGLYISSKTKGSGKTMLACCLGNELIQRRGIEVKFTSVTEYISAEKEERETLRNCRVLIVDDFGAQSEKEDWVREVVFGLVNRRYENILTTIYTSNNPLASASKEERVQSRIYAVSQEIVLPNVSVRKKLADKQKAEFMKEILKG